MSKQTIFVKKIRIGIHLFKQKYTGFVKPNKAWIFVHNCSSNKDILAKSSTYIKMS